MIELQGEELTCPLLLLLSMLGDQFKFHIQVDLIFKKKSARLFLTEDAGIAEISRWLPFAPCLICQHQLSTPLVNSHNKNT